MTKLAVTIRPMAVTTKFVVTAVTTKLVVSASFYESCMRGALRLGMVTTFAILILTE